MTSPDIGSTATTASSDNDKKTSFDDGLTLALILLAVVAFVTIIIFVLGIIVVWRTRKNMHIQCNKPEGACCSNTDEIKLQRQSINKPEATHVCPYSGKVSGTQLMKTEPLYVEICEGAPSFASTETVINPNYYCVNTNKVKMQDNPAYSFLPPDRVKMQDNLVLKT